jgi:hypothetical protein
MREKESKDFKWRLMQDILLSKQESFKDVTVLNEWAKIREVEDLWELKKRNNQTKPAIRIKKNLIVLDGIYADTKRNEQDYLFSADVYIDNEEDDDMIGLLFRVQDKDHFYMFGWEREATIQQKGQGRILISEQGISAVLYIPNATTEIDPQSKFYLENNLSDYLNMGNKTNKKKIFKATKNQLASYGNTSKPIHERVYSANTTTQSFYDITDYAQDYRKTGWFPHKNYRITAEVSGNEFYIYIKDLDNKQDTSEKGTLVCTASDDGMHQNKGGGPYKKGSYGIACISQKDVYWTNLSYRKVERKSVVTTYYNSTLSNYDWEKIKDNNKGKYIKAQELLEGYINKAKVGWRLESIRKIKMEVSNSQILGEIKGDGYPYAKPISESVLLGPLRVWKSEDYGYSIYGSIKVTIDEYGNESYVVSPSFLQKKLPDYVTNFKWNQVEKLSHYPGVTYDLGINSNQQVYVKTLEATALPIGNIITINDVIEKTEGLKVIGNLFTKEYLYGKMGIPENVFMKDIELIVERGNKNAFSNDLSTRMTANKSELKVNYRFLIEENNNQKLVVDQKTGKNVLKLASIMENGIPQTVEKKLEEVISFDPGLGSSIYVGASQLEKSWKYNATKDVIDFVKNEHAFSGFVDRKSLTKEDIEAKITFKPVKDEKGEVDDDLICFMFKAKTNSNGKLDFYMMVVESDYLYRHNFVNKNSVFRYSDEIGKNGSNNIDIYNDYNNAKWKSYEVSARDYQTNHLKYFNEYQKQKGWKTFHKKLFKVTNGKMELMNQGLIHKNYNGWVFENEHTVTIRNMGKTCQVFFDEIMCYQLTTSGNESGYGIGTISQAIQILNIKEKSYAESLKKKHNSTCCCLDRVRRSKSSADVCL